MSWLGRRLRHGPDGSAGAEHPGSLTERLFEGAKILARQDVVWKSMRAELVTMHRGVNVTNDLLTDNHVLFMGIDGKPHRATVTADGVPDWQGTKGKGGSAFYAAGRRMRSWQSEGVGTTLVLFFGSRAIEDLLHDERALAWHSQPSADDAFIAANSAELAVAMGDTCDDLAGLRAETIATSIHLYVTRRFSNLAKPRSTGGDSVGRALDLIHASLPKAVSLDDLAVVSGLSRGHLLTAFRARTRISPHQYIIRERLSRAQFLLSTTNRLIADVADVVGCAGPEHLGRMFRQHLGMSPLAWRRLNDRRA